MVDNSVGNSISFSYTTSSAAHHIHEEPIYSTSQETIPASAFSHHASTIQAVARYLVDVRGKTITEAARMIGRKPKALWTSYHQTTALPALDASIPIPLSIFSTTMAPLEALVLYLKSKGLRNVEVARLLRLDPKTTWTAAKRGEAKQ